jgi:hypothetical protein
MRASLDGRFDSSTVLEIKCPANARDQTAAQLGTIPPQYYTAAIAIRLRSRTWAIERHRDEEASRPRGKNKHGQELR